MGVNINKFKSKQSTLFRFKFSNINTFKEKNEIKNLNKLLIISGMGAGHGVGMSQWGAKYLAMLGYKAKDILKYYYKGIQIQPFKEIYKY